MAFKPAPGESPLRAGPEAVAEEVECAVTITEPVKGPTRKQVVDNDTLISLDVIADKFAAAVKEPKKPKPVPSGIKPRGFILPVLLIAVMAIPMAGLVFPIGLLAKRQIASSEGQFSYLCVLDPVNLNLTHLSPAARHQYYANYLKQLNKNCSEASKQVWLGQQPGPGEFNVTNALRRGWMLMEVTPTSIDPTLLVANANVDVTFNYKPQDIDNPPDTLNDSAEEYTEYYEDYQDRAEADDPYDEEPPAPDAPTPPATPANPPSQVRSVDVPAPTSPDAPAPPTSPDAPATVDTPPTSPDPPATVDAPPASPDAPSAVDAPPISPDAPPADDAPPTSPNAPAAVDAPPASPDAPEQPPANDAPDAPPQPGGVAPAPDIAVRRRLAARMRTHQRPLRRSLQGGTTLNTVKASSSSSSSSNHSPLVPTTKKVYKGPLINPKKKLAMPKNTTVDIGFASAAGADVAMKPGDRSMQKQLKINMNADNVMFNYPFDRYSVPFMTTVSAGNETVEFAPVPVFVRVRTSLPGYVVKVKQGSSWTDQYIDQSWTTALNYDVTFHRAWFVKMMAIMILAGMWLLASCAISYAMDLVFFRPRTASTGDAGLFTVLLFAMNNIRGVMPGVPPIGQGVDFFGFIWIMMFMMVMAAMVYAKVVGQYIHEDPTLYDKLLRTTALQEWEKQQAEKKSKEAAKEAAANV